jgi:hypothetical protein
MRRLEIIVRQHLLLIAPTLVEILVWMTDTDALSKTLSLLHIFRMRNFKHSRTCKMIVLLFDLVHDLSHFRRSRADRIVLREERLQGFRCEMPVWAAV